MASVSRGNLSSTRLPRPMSTQGRGWIPGARHLPSGHDVNICWNSVGDSAGILIDSHISIHFPRDFHGFPKISRRSPEVGHAVRTQIKQRALLVEFNGAFSQATDLIPCQTWPDSCFNIFELRISDFFQSRALRLETCHVDMSICRCVDMSM